MLARGEDSGPVGAWVRDTAPRVLGTPPTDRSSSVPWSRVAAGGGGEAARCASDSTWVIRPRGSTPADHLAMAQEADRLGYSVVWAAEAYGSDAPTDARLAGRADVDASTSARRHADPGPHPGGDGDDGGHARHAVRRPVPARARRLRPAGVRGLARRPVRQAAGPHPGVRRHRPSWRSRRQPVAYDGELLHAAAARRSGQGAAAGLPPAARATSRSTWPPSGRRTWSWPARWPTAGWRSSTRRVHAAESLAAGGGRPGEGRPDHGGLRRGASRAGRGRRRRGSVRRTRSAGTRRSTSAAWAAGSRTSTTSCAVRMGFGDAAATVQDLYLDKRQRERGGRRAAEFIDRDLAARPGRAHRGAGSTRTPRPG